MPTTPTLSEIQNSIHIIRGCEVMLDSDLALLYGVDPKTLHQAVRRNIERFPEDAAFQLTIPEWQALRLQNEASNEGSGRGGRRYAPRAFTELGVSMLSSVLRSPEAIATNLAIMRAFLAIRRALRSVPSQEMSGRLLALEDASKLHETRLGGIETTLAAMEAPKLPQISITVQGDVIGSTIAGILDTISTKVPQLALNPTETARLQDAIRYAKNEPHSPRGREALHVIKAMLEHAGGAVIGHGILAQLAKLLG